MPLESSYILVLYNPVMNNNNMAAVRMCKTWRILTPFSAVSLGLSSDRAMKHMRSYLMYH
jgi:hypothetical protein